MLLQGGFAGVGANLSLSLVDQLTKSLDNALQTHALSEKDCAACMRSMMPQHDKPLPFTRHIHAYARSERASEREGGREREREREGGREGGREREREREGGRERKRERERERERDQGEIAVQEACSSEHAV